MRGYKLLAIFFGILATSVIIVIGACDKIEDREVALENRIELSSALISIQEEREKNIKNIQEKVDKMIEEYPQIKDKIGYDTIDENLNNTNISIRLRINEYNDSVKEYKKYNNKFIIKIILKITNHKCKNYKERE